MHYGRSHHLQALNLGKWLLMEFSYLLWSMLFSYGEEPTSLWFPAFSFFKTKQRELIVYHNCLFLFKTKSVSEPAYFQAKFTSQTDQGLSPPIASRTRLPSTNGIRAANRIQSDLDKQNFCYMGVQSWNMLPAEIRQERKLMVFKRKLRDWIKMNISIR